jgi:hypothetical protein
MKVALLCLAALMLGACATSSSTTSSQASGKSLEDKEYRSGSRIPVRDPSTQGASSVKSVDPSAPRVN